MDYPCKNKRKIAISKRIKIPKVLFDHLFALVKLGKLLVFLAEYCGA